MTPQPGQSGPTPTPKSGNIGTPVTTANSPGIRAALAAPIPLRAHLAPEVEAAARTIHRDVWGEPYRAGQGPMHFAGGPYWRNELQRRANRWERLAAAARVCADALPGEDD